MDNDTRDLAMYKVAEGLTSVAVFERVRRYLRKLGVSQRTYCVESGIDPKNFARYAQGRVEANLETKLKAMRALKAFMSEGEDDVLCLLESGD